MKNEEKLRRDWDRELKHRHGVKDQYLRDSIWADLRKEGHVDAYACSHPEVGLEDLLQSARPYLKGAGFAGGGSRRDSVHRKTPVYGQAPEEESVDDTEPSPYGILRSDALSEYLATLAESDREVRGFRSTYLDGKTITPEEAQELATSSAARILPKEQFDKHGIPITGHCSEVLATHKSPTPARKWSIKATLRIEWPGSSYEGSYSYQRNSLAPSRPRFESLEFYEEQTRYLKKVPLWSHSVLDDLRKVVQKLQERYPWHQEGTVTHFVLTGTPPWVPPQRARTSISHGLGFDYGSITMTVQSWVPAESVKAFYQRIQKQMSVGRKPAERHLAVFCFVTERTQIQPGESSDYGYREIIKPPREQLLAEWNRRYRKGHEWHYGQLSNFLRDYRKGYMVVAFPDYTLPERDEL